MRKVFALTTVLIAAMALAACSSGGGGGAGTPPGPVGPISSVNGFPTYYRDPAGLTLALCSPNDAGLCLADLVDSGNPYSVQIGMGAEAFYWSANASVPVAAGGALPTGGSADLTLALEAAFSGTGAPAAGQQMTFSRLRIRVGVTTAGTYTITHPYGLVSYAVTTPGVDAINDFVAAPIVPGSDSTGGRIGDVGCVVAPFNPPCDFSVALNGATFPFLVWDPALAPASPAGYIGIPTNAYPVVGSPTGNNFFRVQGPAGSNLGGPGDDVIETNLFTVSGKKY